MKRRFGWACVVGVVLVGMPSTFAAHPSHDTVINGTFDDPGFVTGFEGVSPAPPSVPSEAVFHGTSRVFGKAMHGHVVYELWGSPNMNGYFDFHTVEQFTGFVAGCGHGTMTYKVVGTSKPYGPSDPADQHLQANWTVLAGSGRGGLARVQSGGGQLDGRSGPTTANSGRITGVVRCATEP